MIGNLLMVPQSLQDDCIWEKPQISVIIALFLFATMKDLEARWDAENMSRQSMGWYLYFDPKPDIREIEEKHSSVWTTVQVDGRSSTQELPTFPKPLPLAVNFLNWLQSTAGGGKTKQHSEQVSSHVLKFLRAVNEDAESEEINEMTVDYYLGSIECIQIFVNLMENEWKLSHSGQLGYLNAIYDLMNCRKSTGVSSDILTNFSISDIYLKRAKKCVSKRMNVQSNKELDIETLESKRRWATLKELQQAIPFHLNHYKRILEKCKVNGLSAAPSELTFAVRFMTIFLFLHVKGIRPMTYQYLTVDMFDNAKRNNAFIDQKKLKTATTYAFVSLTLEKDTIKVIDDYITYIRPSSHPQCSFILISKKGYLLSRLSDVMG